MNLIKKKMIQILKTHSTVRDMRKKQKLEKLFMGIKMALDNSISENQLKLN